MRYFILLATTVLLLGACKETVTRVPYKKELVPENLKGVWKKTNTNKSVEYFEFNTTENERSRYIYVDSANNKYCQYFSYFISGNQIRMNEIYYRFCNYRVNKDTLDLEVNVNYHDIFVKAPQVVLDSLIKPVKEVTRFVPPYAYNVYGDGGIARDGNYLYYSAGGNYLYKLDMAKNKLVDSLSVGDDCAPAMGLLGLYLVKNSPSKLYAVSADFNTLTAANNSDAETPNSLSYDAKSQYFYASDHNLVWRTKTGGNWQDFATFHRDYDKIVFYKENTFLAEYGSALVRLDKDGKVLQSYRLGDGIYVAGVSCINGDVWLITYNDYTNAVEFVLVELD